MKQITKALKNLLGVTMIFGFYAVAVWSLTRWWAVSLDRAIELTVLWALAQVRWFQEDKSPFDS